MVVVCRSAETVLLCNSPPPKHWRWYLVMIPFGISGGPQLKSINDDSTASSLNSVGGDPGPAKINCDYSELSESGIQIQIFGWNTKQLNTSNYNKKVLDILQY